MKIEKGFIILFFLGNISSFSQVLDTIKGQLFFSKEFYKNFNHLSVKENSSNTYVKLNESGEFKLVSEESKEEYELTFYYLNNIFKKYSYKNQWIKRSRFKSISLADNCEYNKKTAYSDFKNKKLKLYVLEENKKNKKLEIQNIKEEYSLEYIYFKEIKLFDCYLEYNKQILKILTIKYGREILNKIDKDVIGLE